ncbi:motility associated factor glycosyltransferase family protein [Salidesulfovibrio brasiliensis]|uniref:motility associated factor glycosyltransferase family protein n=1 Tax=Salidesulfovibrio brasiliensis TaxID=221711 RepID=UPI0034E24C49
MAEPQPKDETMIGYPFLKDNIEALKDYCPPVYMWLSSQEYDPERLNERLFKNQWDILDWRIDNEEGRGMFDAMPPNLLYKEWAPKDKPHTSATVIVGCNVGYGLNHVLANSPDSHKIVVVEPRPEMLLACLGQTDYRPFFANKKLHICPPNEDYFMQIVKNMDLQFIYGNIHLRGDTASRQLGPEYAKWTRLCQERLENFSLELTTLRFRQDVMVGNELKNFQRALHGGSMKPLEGRAAGVGAVILGAGPSLADSAKTLAENPGYALYTTALQTMPALQPHGLKPHLCMALDYDGSMRRIYDRLDPEFAKDVPLIYSTKVDPWVVEQYPGPKMPMWTVGGLATYLMREHELVLDAGGNVSLTLARLLRWLGVGHITLVGQDFAWINERSHSDGHHATRKQFEFDPKRHQKLKNMDGEEIISTPQYLTAKRDLEEDLKKAPFPIYNVYGGGAPINGSRRVTLEEAIMQGAFSSAPGSLERFMADFEASRDISNPIHIRPASHEWASSLRRVEKRLTKLFRNCRNNQKEIHQALTQVDMFVKQNPVYLPYLYNETLNLAGLTRAKATYEPRDLSEFKRISKSILQKVREVDRHVCPKQAA